MARLTRHQISFQPLISRLPTKLGSVLLAIIVFTCDDALHAEPITLTFEATVFDVFRSPDTTINLDVEDGDRLMGRFSFEPFFLPPLDNPLERQDATVFQSYEASLQIGENSFHTPASPESLMRNRSRPGVKLLPN